MFVSRTLLTMAGSSFVNEVLDLVASIVNDAINAKIKVCVICTEQLLEEFLQFLLGGLHVFCTISLSEDGDFRLCFDYIKVTQLSKL